MSMRWKVGLLALSVASLGACAPRRTDLGGALDASSFFVPPDGGAPDGDADGGDVPVAMDASTDLGPPCLIGGTSADVPATVSCAQAPLGRVVVAGDHVYWTVQAGGAIVLRAPLSGGGPEALVSDFAGAFGLLVDDQFIYYTQPALGRVMRAPLAGGETPVELATKVVGPLFLSSDGQSLYWTGAGGPGTGVVMKLALQPDAKPITLVDGQASPRALAVRDGFVYWTDVVDGTLLRTPDHVVDHDAGFLSADRLASGLKMPSDLLLAGDHAYVPDRAGHVVRVPVAGGALESVADVDGPPYGLATDGAVLYWSVLGADGGIFTGPLAAAGGKGTLVVGGQPDPHFVAATSENVYWAAWGPRPSVRRLARQPARN